MIAVLSDSFSKNETLMSELRAAFPHDKITDSPFEAEAAIVGLTKIDETFFKECPKLKFISKFGVGLDNIDLRACEQNWVRFLWTPGVNAQAVAEHTLGLILALKRNIFKNSTLLKSGVWSKNGGQGLQGLKIGVIGGFGNVAHALKNMLYRLEPEEVLTNDLERPMVQKEQIYRECDVITLHVPLTPETHHMITMHELMRMKRSAVLINTSRGAVIKQAALKEALRRGLIAGAALDVYEDEPCTDMELLKMDNVICTPHTAGNSEQAVLAMGRVAIENLKKMVKP